ncbi:MAG: carbon storage regulator [Planctomycetota bacterium]|nr:carbon storage regulator [Planctomycetota bacterium]
MLVLSRKVGQEVIIAGTIKVTISRISGSRVAIGVDAPDSMRIVRGELAPFDSKLIDQDELAGRDDLAGQVDWMRDWSGNRRLGTSLP